MSNSRSDRFKRLYPKRLKNAVWSIRSIGKLSNRSNYVYEEEEVEKIFSTLMFELKAAISKFGKGTVEERFKRYLEIDFKQLNVIKETDPELYDYIIDKFDRNGGANLLEHYLKESLSDEKESDELIVLDIDATRLGYEPNFDLISRSITDSLMYLSIKHKKPIGNGIITCFNYKQAISRRKKGEEAALAVKEVLSLNQKVTDKFS